MTIAVLLVDDDALVRQGLSFMLRGSPQIEVVGEAGDGDEVVEAVSALRPDVILMDVRMDRVSGIAATRAVRAEPNAPHVIMLTTFDADHEVLEALRAGAAGYLLKDTSPAEIVRAIEHVVVGEPILSPSVTRRLMDLAGAASSYRARDSARARLRALTDREQEVAAALGQGLSNVQIGAATYMSTATVKSYVSRLLEKLGAANRVQIALLVQQADLTNDNRDGV